MVIRNVINFDRMDTIYYEAHKNLYINLTNRCSADCIFCIRNFADGVYGYDLRLSKEPSTEEIIGALEEPGSFKIQRNRIHGPWRAYPQVRCGACSNPLA